MLAEESDHTECLRLRPEWFTSNQEGQPRLSCAKILTLLRERTGFDTAPSKGKTTASKKQSKAHAAANKRSHDADSDSKARKRVKVSVDDAISISDIEEERLVHAYQRVFRIRYTTATADHVSSSISEEDAEAMGWVGHERALREWLIAFADTVEESHVVDLGLVTVDDFSWPPTYVRDTDEQSHIITKLPSLRHGFRFQDYDIHQRSRPFGDPLQAFQILANAGRARIVAHLYLVLSPAQSSDEMPFHLRVQVDCSFVCPKIFEPIVAVSKASSANSRVAELQEAQRRLFIVLFPPQSPVPNTFHGNTDIPFLFSILQPAPALPSNEAYDALQPESLLPTLLPFQRRTVAWMMDREGKTVTANGDIIPVSDIDVASRPLPLFWDAFPISTEDTWYVNRLRGIVSPKRPSGEDDDVDEEALGGIVAEEPGLGKTLECISTVIMNPAPDRSPVNKRWDTEAQIDVREIKVGNLSWMRSHIAYLLVDHAYRYSALIGAAVGG